MRHAKFRYGALGLCLTVALGLAALSVVGAQAESTARWMVAGADITGATTKSVTGEIDKKAGAGFPKLLSSVPGGLLIAIECKEFEITGGLIEKEGSGKGTLTFKSCLVYDGVGLPLDAKCMVKEPITAAVKGLLVLIGGSKLFLVKPETGTTFTEILFLSVAPKTCGLPEGDIAITGTADLKDCEDLFSTEQATHLVIENTTGGVDGLKFGANAATIDGSVILKLVGGANWSALV